MKRLFERLVCPGCFHARWSPGHLVRVVLGICRL